ncbi:hypothetical protein SAMN03080603_01749 [Acetomicrobium thermoterrenum DSM 13490]|uniref:YprB ribonuclease H-like domain-containing protein n=1 Tax=Acetomicrobium thermoterrenum DSM 13490 TaxID=1120987 RepID=A0A1H3H2E0_9BACT|nr:ribonuclease H-like domain-containing protein [Acetomicrobium thermoterrenum]SDY09510.1 hypothetical protein SAMN03080603_01749 [Acetomicrobium thermoterrenum DSM 13490]
MNDYMPLHMKFLLDNSKRKNEERKRTFIKGLPSGQFLDDDVYFCESKHEMLPYKNRGELENHLQILSHWGAKEPLVFFDLETTGLSGGTGTYAFLAGIGMLDQDQFIVRQLFLCSPRAEGIWLQKLMEIIPYKPSFVTYNGKNFDLPLINTRFILSRMEPIEPTGHLDLLHLARRLWKKRIGSCTLSNVEKQILGIDRKTEDVPGFLIPELYAQFLKTGDASGLSGVFYHNKMDILSLYMLFSKVALTLSGRSTDPHEIDMAGDAWYNYDLNKASHLWEKASSLTPPAKNAIWKLAIEYKRQGDHCEALSLFKKLYDMEYKRIDVAVEISKIYEHQLKNAKEALLWAEKAMDNFLRYRPFLSSIRKEKMAELTKRIDRLRNKIRLR